MKKLQCQPIPPASSFFPFSFFSSPLLPSHTGNFQRVIKDQAKGDERIDFWRNLSPPIFFQPFPSLFLFFPRSSPSSSPFFFFFFPSKRSSGEGELAVARSAKAACPFHPFPYATSWTPAKKYAARGGAGVSVNRLFTVLPPFSSNDQGLYAMKAARALAPGPSLLPFETIKPWELAYSIESAKHGTETPLLFLPFLLPWLSNNASGSDTENFEERSSRRYPPFPFFLFSRLSRLAPKAVGSDAPFCGDGRVRPGPARSLSLPFFLFLFIATPDWKI